MHRNAENNDISTNMGPKRRPVMILKTRRRVAMVLLIMLCSVPLLSYNYLPISHDYFFYHLRTSDFISVSGGLYPNRSWRPFYRRTDIFSRPDKPRILFWTPVFGGWFSGLSKSGTAELRYWQPLGGCAYRCYIANDRRTLSVSDAVVFYACDLNASDFPVYRAGGQKWVLWSLEAPTSCDLSPMVTMKDAFNWTMTYRRDSDVRDQYAKVTQRAEPSSYSVERLELTWRNKKVMAVWAVSHCKTFGKRENFVDELRQHMSVDVYGKCGNFSCSRDVRYECYEMFEREYFFLLSFENTACKDYVTEKLYLALLYDIIPVTFGGADYQALAPPGSYIDALQFKTPKDLANYLREVAKNFDLYKNFFDWKGWYDVEPWAYYTFCELCTKLYSSSFRQKSLYPNMIQWWNHSSHCRAWNPETKQLYG